jgi:succinoglycan biosynthesis transport protein ExoP
MADWAPGNHLGQPLEDGLSARALLSSIRRHLFLVLTSTFLLAVGGYLIGLGQPAWYQAEGVLVLHAQPPRTAEIQELPDPSPDMNVMQSELDILKSSLVIEPVVRSLKLWQAPEFESPPGWSWQLVEARLGQMWRDFWGLSREREGGSHDKPNLSTQPSDSSAPTQALIDATVSAYAGYLVAGNDGHSNTIHITYRALTPQRAATIVNAHIDSYQEFGVKTKVAAAERANSALTAQVGQLQEQLLAAEAAVTRYREEHHLTGAGRDVSGQLASLYSQLISIRAELAEEEARAAGIRTGGESLPEVVGSGTIAGLRGQEVQLAAREATLSKDHGDQYPELQHVRATLEHVREQIARQIGRDRSAALQTVDRTRTREQSLQQSIMELTRQLNSADAGLEQLQGNADSIRSLLRSFEKRVEETAANPAFITPNSTVASRANPTAASTSSKTNKLVLAGGFAGLTLGSLLSLLLELRDKGFRTSSQVQQHIGSLTVSGTPRAVGRKRKSPADIILDDSRGALAEAFRVSWANIHLAITESKSDSAAPARLQGTALGITSAASGEGKSTHALALARTAAQAGENVVLIDADLRRSGLSRLLGRDFRFSLTDFLQDRCAADDIITVEERSGVHFVPSAPGDVSWTSHDLRRFSGLVEHLKNRFAIVIIDMPPIVGLADTIRLARAVDGIALVIRWGRTERQRVQFALDTLRSASISTIAVILNDIDLKALRWRGYSDHAVVYTDKGLYQAAPGYQGSATAREAPLPTAAAASTPGAHPVPSLPEIPSGDAGRNPPRPAASDIERLYNRYHD